MLHFFRKIRRDLLGKGKILRYLKYGIGEIILVVIGILIAIQVDDWNQNRENEEKARNILSDIMVELRSDIERSTWLMRYNMWRDSTIFLVLNDRLTKEDYEKNEIPHLFSLTKWRNSFDPTRDAYNTLIQNLDILPQEYKNVLEDLSELHNRYGVVTKDMNNALKDLIQENNRIKSQNYPWHSSSSPEDQKSHIEFMLFDFRYKNEVSDYREAALVDQLFWTIYYRQKAIECYKKLAQMLDKSGYDNSFTFDQEVAKILIGDWEVIGEPETILSFFEDDKRLYLKDNVNQGRHEIFWLPPYKILSDNLEYGSLVKNGGEYIIKFNSFDLKRVE